MDFLQVFLNVTLGDHKDLPLIAHESFRLMMNHVVFNLKHHEGCSTPPTQPQKNTGSPTGILHLSHVYHRNMHLHLATVFPY